MSNRLSGKVVNVVYLVRMRTTLFVSSSIKYYCCAENVLVEGISTLIMELLEWILYSSDEGNIDFQLKRKALELEIQKAFNY